MNTALSNPPQLQRRRFPVATARHSRWRMRLASVTRLYNGSVSFVGRLVTKSILHLACLIVFVAAVAGVGPVTPVTNKLLLLAGIATMLAVLRPRVLSAHDRGYSMLRLLGFAAAFVSAICAMTWSRVLELRFAGLSLFFLTAILLPDQKQDSVMAGWAAACAVVVSGFLIVAASPVLSTVTLQVFRDLTSLCGQWWADRPTPTGPSMLGGFSLAATFAFITAACVLRLISIPRCLLCGSLVCLSAVAILRHLYSTSLLAKGPVAMALAGNLESMVMCSLVCAIALLPERRPVVSRRVVRVLVLVLSALTFAALFAGAERKSLGDTHRPSRVWIWGKPGTYSSMTSSITNFPALVDWRKPSSDSFGLGDSGLFGLLPDYFRLLQDKVEISNDDARNLSLGRCDLLVIINPLHGWTDEECSRLEEYVKSGGALLVLGDHTDLAGSQAPLNRILRFTGIRFNFDSGCPFRPAWQNCADLGASALTAGLHEDIQMQISIGATLQVMPPAMVLVRGKYGFGDSGNYQNAAGANLGNYTFEIGEPIGDVALVAGQQCGRGRVLVFGDTSSFQNLALPQSFRPFVRRCLEWLEGSHTTAVSAMWPLLAGLFTIGLCWQRIALAPFLAAMTCLAVVIFSPHSGSRVAPRSAARQSVAWIPNCLMPDDRTKDAPHGAQQAVANNSARAGYLPLFVDEAVPMEASPGDLLWLTNPRRPITPGEAGKIIQFVDAGGFAILNTSPATQSACKHLLRRIGMNLADIPLGPVPVNLTDTNAPQFVEAWPIQEITNVTSGVDAAVSRESYVLYSYHGLPVVAYIQIGSGGVVLIGDARFLSEENLESAFSSRFGNVAFLQRILARISEGSPRNRQAGTNQTLK